MVIRRSQMGVFAEYMRDQFSVRMQKHLRTAFPEYTKALDEASLRELIASGIEKAAGYNFEFEDVIQRYLEYTILLSEDFDTDPATSWAGNILRDADSASRKMSRIDDAYLFSRGRPG
jgi:hypothetical protein